MRRCVMVLITVQLLALPAVASANPVQTTVDSATVNGASRFVVDINNPPTVHITGTANTSSVDLYCVFSSPGLGFNAINIASAVTVTGNAFATDATWPNGVGVCEIFAVDSGALILSNTDLTGLTGLSVYPAYYTSFEASGKTFDYFVVAEGSGAEVGFDSFGDCTMDYALLVQMHEYDGQPFDCNGYVESIDQAAGGNTPSIVVDQHPAFPPAYIRYEGLDAVPGWSGVLFSVTDNAGAWEIKGQETIYRCAGSDVFPPDSCTAFTSTGVRLDVDEVLSPNARTIRQTLRLVSVDGQPHKFSVVLNQLSPLPREWSFPGAGGFLGYNVGAGPTTIAPAVATIRNRESGSADPDITTGFGAITYSSTPASEVFWNDGRYFVQRYPNLNIPANKAAKLVFVYNIAPGTSALDPQVAAAESSFGAPPAISVTSASTTTSSAYTLAGTVNAPETLNAFTVNDQPVTVDSGGSFALPATLTAGANQFALKATDELGRTTTAPFTVTLGSGQQQQQQQQQQQPPPGNTVLGVVFASTGKPKLRGRALATGLTAACPGSGPDCTVGARGTVPAHVAAKVLVATKRTVTVKSGATAKLKLTISKPALKLLKRAHRLKLTLVLTGKRTGATTTTATRTLTLKLKR